MDPSAYQQLKLFFITNTDLSRDGLHVILGFIVFLLAAYLFKLALSSIKSLIAPYSFAFLIEIFDYIDNTIAGIPIDWADTATDIFFTILLPTLTLIFMRLSRKKESTHNTPDEELHA